MRGTLSITFLFFTIETETISIGDATYTKDPETGVWEVSTGDDVPLANHGDLVQLDPAYLRNVTLEAEETLVGRAVYRISA